MKPNQIAHTHVFISLNNVISDDAVRAIYIYAFSFYMCVRIMSELQKNLVSGSLAINPGSASFAYARTWKYVLSR